MYRITLDNSFLISCIKPGDKYHRTSHKLFKLFYSKHDIFQINEPSVVLGELYSVQRKMPKKERLSKVGHNELKNLGKKRINIQEVLIDGFNEFGEYLDKNFNRVYIDRGADLLYLYFAYAGNILITCDEGLLKYNNDRMNVINPRDFLSKYQVDEDK